MSNEYQYQPDPMLALYQKYKGCIVRVTTLNSNGDLSNGAGFHIGGGYIVTARHNVENRSIDSISPAFTYQTTLNVEKCFFSNNSKIDLAVLKTNFYPEPYINLLQDSPAGEVYDFLHFIPLGIHQDSFITDDVFILSKVLLFGYPKIPFSSKSDLVVVEGRVNATIDRYNTPHIHFIISTLARGGFSGGPVISEYGYLLGVFIESLLNVEDTQIAQVPQEVGFSCTISIEPLLQILYDNSIFPAENAEVVKAFGL